jgi:hypothetical protein
MLLIRRLELIWSARYFLLSPHLFRNSIPS